MSPVRVILVTIGLMITGGGLGAFCGLVALAAALSVHQMWSWLRDPFTLLFAAAFGLVLGGIIAPITAWLFLREVPLWKAIAHTTIAAALGGAIAGAMFITYPPLAVAGSVLAFLSTAANLYIKAPRSTKDRSD